MRTARGLSDRLYPRVPTKPHTARGVRRNTRDKRVALFRSPRRSAARTSFTETFAGPVSQYSAPRFDAFAYFYFEGTSMADRPRIGAGRAAREPGRHGPGSHRGDPETIGHRPRNDGPRRRVRLRADQRARRAARHGVGAMRLHVARRSPRTAGARGCARGRSRRPAPPARRAARRSAVEPPNRPSACAASSTRSRARSPRRKSFDAVLGRPMRGRCSARTPSVPGWTQPVRVGRRLAFPEGRRARRRGERPSLSQRDRHHDLGHAD